MALEHLKNVSIVIIHPDLSQLAPGRLAVPRKKICLQCHTTKDSELNYTANMWVHGPVSSGQCVVCHDYHESRYQYMLLSKSSIVLCTQCHAKGYLGDSEANQKGDECISCHNPHIGANRLLLRKDFDEIF